MYKYLSQSIKADETENLVYFTIFAVIYLSPNSVPLKKKK